MISKKQESEEDVTASLRVANEWNIPQEEVMTSPVLNFFNRRLDKHWADLNTNVLDVGRRDRGGPRVNACRPEKRDLTTRNVVHV